MRAHVIGAGLAGLSAALALADGGWKIALYEAGPVAGGRCRSYFDRELGCRIDNGNHLVLSGNRAAFAYLQRIGAADSLGGPGQALFPFIDRADGARWALRPNRGRLPWWIFSRERRVPGTRATDYFSLRRVLSASPERSVAALGLPAALYRRLIAPLAIAALNTPPDQGSATLLAAVVRETLARGGAACIPAFPRVGLSESFIDPALAALTARAAEVFFARRIVSLTIEGGRVTALGSASGPIAVAEGEPVVLAVPPPVAADLLPGLMVPDAFEAILNVHFRRAADPGPAGFWGVIGGVAEWVFVKPGIVSVTISAANRLIELPAEEIAALVWPDVRAACDVAGAMPLWRVVKEKRASFAATAAQSRRRPSARTGLANLVLAGDWTATGLPATIEGAIRSGRQAAEIMLHHAPR